MTHLCDSAVKSHSSESWTVRPDYKSAYLSVCDQASTGSQFDDFKRSDAYRVILEHVTEEQGWQYFQIIQQRYPWLTQHYSRFQQNDQWGHPQVFKYDGWEFSPTTLRYIKVLGDLTELFGSLDGFRIAEIGGGYGGQCKIIMDVCRPQEYVQIDLPEVIRLQRNYLDRLAIQRVRFVTPNQVKPKRYDLVISNYSLSELTADTQKYYAQSLLRKSARGYLTWNSADRIDCLQGHANVISLAEDPQTGHNNRILVWNSSESLGERLKSFADARPAFGSIGVL